MARFSDEELQAFFINPERPASWGVCPFCGGTIVLGFRKDNGNQTLAHSALPDPTQPGQHLTGCTEWREVAQINMGNFLRLLMGHSFRFQPIRGV
jgi:hypothetical protein